MNAPLSVVLLALAVTLVGCSEPQAQEAAAASNATPGFATETGVGTAPPDGATVLFDGTRAMLDANWAYWEGPRFAAEMPIKWEIVDDPVVEGGTAMSSFDPAAAGGLYGAADIVTKEKFTDFRLHVEFNITQEGGNSGVYLQNRYEIQILDSDSTTHGLATLINETESPYYAYNGTAQWNAYDVLFRAARFENGELVEKPRATVYFNGQKVHTDHEIQQVYGGLNSGLDGGNDGGRGITDTPGGIKLQAEGHDVRYRNIWIQPLELEAASTDF
ncbi:MAG: DUF1080 domain-containing protein [Bacteroidota bacterium]